MQLVNILRTPRTITLITNKQGDKTRLIQQGDISLAIRQSLKSKKIIAKVIPMTKTMMGIGLTNPSPSTYSEVCAIANKYKYIEYGTKKIKASEPSGKGVFIDCWFDAEIKQDVFNKLCAKYKLDAISINNVPPTITIKGREYQTFPALFSILRGDEGALLPSFWSEYLPT